MKKESTKKKISKTKALTNPKKVNQHTAPDPRSTTFLALYLDPKSETFSNAKQSAIRAGYSEKYADNIMALMPAWLSDSIGELQMLSKAERNLNTFLDLPTLVPAMGAFGPIIDKKSKKPIMVENPKLLGHKKDVSIFVAQTLGRLRYRRSDARPENPGNVPPAGVVAVQVNVNDDRERYA